MELRQYFEVHTNDCGNPTFVMDYETDELIYINQAMEKKFQIFSNYQNQKCNDVIPSYDEICGYKSKSDVKVGEFLEYTFMCDTLNANLRSKTTLVEVGDRKCIQTKYFLAPTSDKRKEAENLFEKAIAASLEILSHSALTSPINSFLELLGEFYSCEMTYICEFDRDNMILSNRYIWLAEHNAPLQLDSEEVTMEDFVSWLENDHHKSVINLDKYEHNFESHTIEEIILQKFNIRNITLSKLWNKDGSLMGIVGLSNRAELMYDDRLLQAISHFVMEQFNQKSMVEALEDLNDMDLLTGFYNRSKYADKLIELERNPPKHWVYSS